MNLLNFDRDVCSYLPAATSREWLVTNGIGGYACGTISGVLTRRYHGLLVAALKPPLARTLLLAKLDETVEYLGQYYPLYTNHWLDGTIEPQGYQNLAEFSLEGTVPVWRFALGDGYLEKRIWMQSEANTTYIHYTFTKGVDSLNLAIKALVNYRDHHYYTVANGWQMNISRVNQGVCIQAFEEAKPFYLLANSGNISIIHDWYYNFDLALERYRGLSDHEDHLHAATLTVTLQPGESFTVVASTEHNPELVGETALALRHDYEQNLLNLWHNSRYGNNKNAPSWLSHLVLAADQFLVNRASVEIPNGKTIIAGYPWFSDWGRDTMISIPGLTLCTGRPEIAVNILRTFARYLDQGMLPNVFPDDQQTPAYNTVDAILWYFEAIRSYISFTQDQDFAQEIFPLLAEVIDWHCQGTRYNIHLDDDGLLYAGEVGHQLTWMDAKVGEWVITPRIGKPIEVNALWYNALTVMTQLAEQLGQDYTRYEQMAAATAKGFQRFWQESLGYCYDVIDTPQGHDSSLRPNQIFAVSLGKMALLEPYQAKAVVDVVREDLLIPVGLRSLSPNHPHYQGRYGGNPLQRDSAYHQGTAWAWLIGHFIQAHLQVYQDRAWAQGFLAKMVYHLQSGCVGNISEIFDGDAPFAPRGCFAQAWSVAEFLRAWFLCQNF